MDLVELKDIWARTDKYFQFSYDEYRSFGPRLRKWRELNALTQRDIANAFYHAYDLYHDSTTDSIMRMYGKWEKIDTGLDVVFSIYNLKILKNLLKVDYDFLFCESDTPHKYTKAISNKTGLSVATIEKLSALTCDLNCSDDPGSARYAHAVLSSLDAILSDDDLLCYMSYFLTRSSVPDDGDHSISVLKPLNGCDDEDSLLDGENMVLSEDMQLSVFTMTLVSKLINLRDRHVGDIDFSYAAPGRRGNAAASFGLRLKSLRTAKNLTQNNVAELISRYRSDHDMPVIDLKNILRTYQNWEGRTDINKDIRISLQDLQMLKDIMDCDYEYLLCESDVSKSDGYDISRVLGLSDRSIKKLQRFATSLYRYNDKAPAFAASVLSAFDLIVSDNDLLSNLTFFLSDLTFYIRSDDSEILWPLDTDSPVDAAYRNMLFAGREDRNVFLPYICKRLELLRDRYHNNQLH